jgi:phage terminase large subunit
MQTIAQRFAEWRAHPAKMVRELFKIEPDPWQEEALESFPHDQRIAMKACKGPGKTAVLAWLAWNFLLTRPHPKVLATSIAGDNLADGLWTEMALWRSKCPLLAHVSLLRPEADS